MSPKAIHDRLTDTYWPHVTGSADKEGGDACVDRLQVKTLARLLKWIKDTSGTSGRGPTYCMIVRHLNELGLVLE